MALTLGDNFSYGGAKPLDARLKYSTTTEMKAVADATMYDGCLAYCTGTDKTYQWKSTNTVDESTGKWREFSSGGGGGSSYTAGDGIDITNDVISTKQSEEGDIDEIIGSLPSGGMGVTLVNAFNKSDLYSTEEKMIGQWTDGKPLYSKTFNLTTGNTTSQTLISNLGSLNIDTMVSITGKLVNSGLTVTIPAYLTATGYVGMYHDPTGNSIVAFVGSDWYNQPVTITLQYTKTIDSAVSIGTANEYSTDEKIVGTWITGEPIYQKTWTGQTTTGTEVDLFSLTGANKIIDTDGYLHNNGYYFHFNYAQGTGNYFSIFVKDNVIKLRKQVNADYDYAITVQYTKTTT